MNLLSGNMRFEVVDQKIGTRGQVGLRRIDVETDGGTIKIYADRDCPRNRAYLLQLDTWALRSLGRFPRMMNEDGNEMLRMSADNEHAVEFYCYSHYQLGCKAPGYNGVILLPV